MMPSAEGAGHRSTPTTVRIAAWSARHRWPVFGLWFLTTIGLFVVSGIAGGIRTEDATGGTGVAQTESARAYDVFDAGGSLPPSQDVIVVITHPTLKATDPAFQAAVADIVARMQATTSGGAPVFSSVADPLTLPPSAGLVAPDLTGMRVAGTVPGDSDAFRAVAPAVRETLVAIKAAHPEFTINGFSNTLINQDINEVVNSDLDSSLRISLPLTFLILLITFGAVAAAVVPLVLALTSLLAAFGLLGLYSQLIGSVSPYATQLVVLIGLAVAVDYSLFMVTRFRTERRAGREVQAAIEVASGTAGRAVFFSGLAVMISVAALFLLPDPLFHSMALGTIAVILVAVVGSLTFLPATLAILGRRVDWGRIPWFGRDRPEESGFWSRLVRAVMRHPAIAAVASTALLLLLAFPVLQLRFGSTDITAFPDDIEGVRAIEQLLAHWPQGSTLTTDVIVTHADRPATQAAIEQLKTAGLQIQGLGQPVTVTPNVDGSVADVAFVTAGTRNDESTQAIVRELRSSVVPDVFGALPDVQVYVSGDAAFALDATSVYTDAMPMVFGFVLGLSFLLLLVAFRSLVIPIKAIILNLLSAAAAYGVMVLVFEKGWFSEALGVKPTPVIEAWVPIFIFTILFGLSMDYHVFILTRVKELFDRGYSSNEAVEHGISATSGTITSAAAIMVVVFAIFASLRLVIIRELGLGLAVAVFLDATVIRSVLLPASMRLLGDWNWYLPRFLQWLPRVTLEAEPEAPSTSSA